MSLINNIDMPTRGESSTEAPLPKYVEASLGNTVPFPSVDAMPQEQRGDVSWLVRKEDDGVVATTQQPTLHEAPTSERPGYVATLEALRGVGAIAANLVGLRASTVELAAKTNKR